MSQLHPIACIQQAIRNFQFPSIKPIKLSTTPTNFTSIKMDIENRIAQYNILTTSSINTHSNDEKSVEKKDETEKDLKNFQDIGRREILHSALHQDFLVKYEDDVRHETSYDKLLGFITEIVGSQSEKQKISEAKKQLQCATRNVYDNERFVRFLEKLKRVAEPISDNSEIKKYLITEAFHNNINRGLRTFLHEHEKSDTSIENIAAYLDRMNKHKICGPLKICKRRV